jgi:hypothetical protein
MQAQVTHQIWRELVVAQKNPAKSFIFSDLAPAINQWPER